MKAAVKTAEKGILLMHETLKAGMTEEELWSILHKTNIENGGEWFETRLLNSGPKQIHGFKSVVIELFKKGDIVAFDTDMVGPYGYCADISRTFVEGEKLSNYQIKFIIWHMKM